METSRLRISDAEHDEGVSRKPSLHAIRESRIASSLWDKMIPSLQLIQAFGPPTPLPLGAGSELVVLVFEQDVERGERAVTPRDVLLQVELVRVAQFIARVHLLLENS